MTGPVVPYADGAAHLADELRRLDLRLRAAAADRTGTEAELAALNARIAACTGAALAAGVALPLPALGRLLGLSAPETQAVVVCLAPELRPGYERPGALRVRELLFPDERRRWAACGLLDPASPLLRDGVLRPYASPSGRRGPDPDPPLAVDPRVCRFLLGGAGVDARLAGLVGEHLPVDPAEAPPDADPELAAGLAQLARHRLGAEGGGARRGLVVRLYGPEGVGRGRLARRVCDLLGVPLLRCDVRELASSSAAKSEGPEAVFRTAVREGLLRGAAVQLAGVDGLLGEEARPLLAALSAAVRDLGWLVFLTGEAEWGPERRFAGTVVLPVAVPLPAMPRAAALWRHRLTGYADDPDKWATELAGLFSLPPARIEAAAELAEARTLLEPGAPGPPASGARTAAPRPGTLDDVTAACRAHAAARLGGLAVKVPALAGWEDLVLPEDRTAQLREVCGQLRHRHRVLVEWGFGARLSHGTGLGVLFSGPPGTGKTMAAEALARDLGMDLFKADLSGVVSKYLGETEKNLARVFDEAGSGNAVLLFDEADALFGRRTEVSDAHDRYANIETSYLLQKMEEFDGLVVLATNTRQNMDDAFVRRLRFLVEFPFPGPAHRERIWRALLPPRVPLAEDLDLALLAREFPLAGGSIKNIVLNAAFLAAAEGGPIARRHVLRGTRREFEKIGKLWEEPDIPC